MHSKPRRSGFRPSDDVSLLFLIAVVLALCFPIFKSIRDGRRREQAAHARR